MTDSGGEINLFAIPNLEGGFFTADLVICGANNFLTMHYSIVLLLDQ